MPIEFPLSFIATAEVVPEPKNGSKTKSSGLVHANRTLLSNSSGF